MPFLNEFYFIAYKIVATHILNEIMQLLFFRLQIEIFGIVQSIERVCLSLSARKMIQT